jgi:mono/diheme cytochrome c family protein
MNKKISLITLFIMALIWFSCGGDNQTKKSSEPQPMPKSMIVEKSDNHERNATTENATETEVEEEIIEEAAEEETAEESKPMTAEQLAKADEIIASVSDADVNALDSKKLFRMHCAICHGFKGNQMINGAKDLTKSKISLTESVAQVYHGKGLMTPYNNILSEAEIVALAKYTETLRKKK